MKVASLKVGDKVICINDDNGSYSVVKGKVYTITRIRGEYCDVKESEVGGHYQTRFELYKEDEQPVKYNMNEAQRSLMVEVAQDVLAQIKAKKYIAKQGRYCVFSKPISHSVFPHELNTQLDNVGTCEVCAKGALFVSLIKKNNNFKASSSTISSNGIKVFSAPMQDRLYQDFDSVMLALIEVAFEKDYYFATKAFVIPMLTNPLYSANSVKYNSKEKNRWKPIVHKAFMYTRRCKTSESRLRVIMLNIIKNNGVFIP